MNSGIISKALLAVVMGIAVLLTAVSPQVGYAAPNEQAETDSFYLLIYALRYAEEKSLFIQPDTPLTSLTGSLTDWLINELVRPNVPVSVEQSLDREDLLKYTERLPTWLALEEALIYLQKYDSLGSTIAKVLADFYIERIAEPTGDTPEAVRGLLTDRIALEMSDRAALVALYNATNGDDWRNSANWLSDLPLDRWHGVGTDAGRVSSLDLSADGLTGKIPSEIGSLARLSYLNLQHNGLTGEIPTEIGNLVELRKMYLNSNKLTGEIPSKIGSLARLSYLALGNNGLTGEIPPEIGNLVELRELALDYNGLTGEIPAEIGNLVELRKMYLNNNKLTGEIPTEIGNLVELRELTLDNNGLTGEIPTGESAIWLSCANCTSIVIS